MNMEVPLHMQKADAKYYYTKDVLSQRLRYDDRPRVMARLGVIDFQDYKELGRLFGIPLSFANKLTGKLAIDVDYRVFAAKGTGTHVGGEGQSSDPAPRVGPQTSTSAAIARGLVAPEGGSLAREEPGATNVANLPKRGGGQSSDPSITSGTGGTAGRVKEGQERSTQQEKRPRRRATPEWNGF